MSYNVARTQDARSLAEGVDAPYEDAADVIRERERRTERGVLGCLPRKARAREAGVASIARNIIEEVLDYDVRNEVADRLGLAGVEALECNSKDLELVVEYWGSASPRVDRGGDLVREKVAVVVNVFL